MEKVEVWRGAHGDPEPLFGPLPGIRQGDTLAYEFRLPDSFVPWPGGTLLERVFVLLDLGVSMSMPAWRSTAGIDRVESGPTTWYVDLVHVSIAEKSITVRDLYADVLVPTDGRHQRLFDLDEFADAIETGQLDLATAVDGLRRWQRFLDRHLHATRDPSDKWTDFPPRRLRDLAALPSPLGPIVTAPG
ncbi:DUF402 domain-containing protein [Amycolatopsis sp. NPDC058340]|uniref:DUF402 domain-containing protein n=1 Tax=Amycolatopsis sp. NPDC058340 TaxID=3346453 RepID=UPI003662A470